MIAVFSHLMPTGHCSEATPAFANVIGADDRRVYASAQVLEEDHPDGCLVDQGPKNAPMSICILHLFAKLHPVSPVVSCDGHCLVVVAGPNEVVVALNVAHKTFSPTCS